VLLSFSCSKSKSNDVTPIASVEVPDPSKIDFSAINAYFDRGFAAATSFQDRGKTQKAVHDQGVLSIAEIVEKNGRSLDYPNVTNPTSTQVPSTFPVPSALHGDVPKFSAFDGGYIHIFNGFNKAYSDNKGEDKKAPHIELVYVCRKYPTTIQEQFHAGYGFPVFKFGNTGTAIMGISKFVDFETKTSDSAGNFRDLECVIVNEVYYNDAEGNGEIFLTDRNGDLISQGKFKNPNIGTSNFINNPAVGAGGHPINHDFFGMWYTLGRVLTTDQRQEVVAKLKQIYPVGKMPDKPYCLPVVKWNNAKKSFDITLNYRPGATGAAMDSSRTVVRWYGGNKRGGEVKKTGNHLDEQSFITATDGRTLSLKRADFPLKFPQPYPSNNLVNVGIIVYDKEGNHWNEVSAAPINDTNN